MEEAEALHPDIDSDVARSREDICVSARVRVLHCVAYYHYLYEKMCWVLLE